MDSLFSFPVGLLHPLQHAGFDPGAPKLDVAGSIPVSRSCFSRLGLTPFLPIPLISNTFEDNQMPPAERPLPVGLLSQAVLCELDPARFYSATAHLDHEDCLFSYSAELSSRREAICNSAGPDDTLSCRRDHRI
jgi:hypothetical protein